MKKVSTSDRLKFLMNARNLRQVDILKLCEPISRRTGIKIGKNDLSQYVNGIFTPGQFKLSVLAEALGVSEQWLMGWEQDDKSSIPFGFSPLPKFKKVPRLGAISCGEPLMTEENFEGYDSVPEYISCDFTLICEGDSMINARINDGDIVYIRQQPVVENGQIAAILIDGEEKLLKRVYITDTSITLMPENSKYTPIVFVGEDMNRVSIIGKAVGFYSNIDK